MLGRSNECRLLARGRPGCPMSLTTALGSNPAVRAANDRLEAASAASFSAAVVTAGRPDRRLVTRSGTEAISNHSDRPVSQALDVLIETRALVWRL